MILVYPKGRFFQIKKNQPDADFSFYLLLYTNLTSPGVEPGLQSSQDCVLSIKRRDQKLILEYTNFPIFKTNLKFLNFIIVFDIPKFLYL